MKDKEIEKNIENFVVNNSPMTPEMWAQELQWLQEHQNDCKRVHCHLCWRGDHKKWGIGSEGET